MKAAESEGIDGGPLWSSAALCRQLFCDDPNPLPLDRPSDYWSQCLGSHRATLSVVDQQTVIDGEESLRKLAIRLKIPEPPGNKRLGGSVKHDRDRMIQDAVREGQSVEALARTFKLAPKTVEKIARANSAQT